MSIEHGMTEEYMAEMGARDALGGEQVLTFEQLKALVAVPDKTDNDANLHYTPLSRLQGIWELKIEPLPEGPEKEELKQLYDQRAFELFSSMIQVPQKELSANPYYQPQKRLSGVDEKIREFPFASAETMERLFDLVDKKAEELPGHSEISHEAEGV
jgi:hypothetical protein